MRSWPGGHDGSGHKRTPMTDEAETGKTCMFRARLDKEQGHHERYSSNGIKSYVTKHYYTRTCAQRKWGFIIIAVVVEAIRIEPGEIRSEI